MGDSKKVTKEEGDIFIAKQVEERIAEVMAGMSNRTGRGKNRRTVQEGKQVTTELLDTR